MTHADVILQRGRERLGGRLTHEDRRLKLDHGDGRLVMDPVQRVRFRPTRAMIAATVIFTFFVVLVIWRAALEPLSVFTILAGAAGAYVLLWILLGRDSWNAVAKGTVAGHDAMWRMQGMTRDNQQQLGRMVREMRRG